MAIAQNGYEHQHPQNQQWKSERVENKYRFETNIRSALQRRLTTPIARYIGNCEQDKIEQTEAPEPPYFSRPTMIDRRATNPSELHHRIATGATSRGHDKPT